MIIGKSITALGSGGLKPEIHVTAKPGALLNLHYKDSSIILQSYQLGAEETQHTFVVSVSDTVYVIEDVTNGKSVEVLVDVIARFDVKISYELYFVKNGVLINGISYAVTHNNYSTGQSGSVTTNPLTITRIGANYTRATFNQSFETSNYTKAVATITSGSSNDTNIRAVVYIGVGSDYSSEGFGSNSIPSRLEYSITVSGNQQLWLQLTTTTVGSNASITFGDVWLE